MSDPQLTGLFTEGLPGPPPADLDPCLDAAASCLAQFGYSRTSITDIAREMGVSRATVYKQVGSVENAFRLFAVRELHRFFAQLAPALVGGLDPSTLVDVVANTVRFVSTHPAVVKVFQYEPDYVGEYLRDGFAGHLEQVGDLLTPFLAAAMDAGRLRRSDARTLATAILRLMASFVFTPAPDDVDAVLRQVLLPVLEP